MSCAFLLHDKRTRVFLLRMAFAGLERGTSGLGLEMTGVVVFCEALLFPDIVENCVANRSGSDTDRVWANRETGINDVATFVFTSLNGGFEGPFGRFDTFLFDSLRGLEGFPVLCSDGARDQKSE